MIWRSYEFAKNSCYPEGAFLLTGPSEHSSQWTERPQYFVSAGCSLSICLSGCVELLRSQEEPSAYGVLQENLEVGMVPV